jgi:hypothetical protein
MTLLDRLRDLYETAGYAAMMVLGWIIEGIRRMR